MRVFAVIPAYNEERTVGTVVRQVQEVSPHLSFGHPLPPGEGRVRVIVVDDGSIDRTATVAREAGALVLRHSINRGLGAALATGIEGALRLLGQPPLNLPLTRGEKEGVIVTLDADGQHDPAEIAQVIKPIFDGRADVVIGSRFLSRSSSRPERSGVERSHMEQDVESLPAQGGSASGGDYARDDSGFIPYTRRLANLFGNFFTWLLFGIWVSDSQSGFRAFSSKAAGRLQLRTSTMEVSSEIIREISRLKLKMVEVPIMVKYNAYSLSKGQGFLKGLETLWKLIVLKFFR